MSKFIFVVGGVMSGVGKGTAAASIGKILQSKGFEVTAIKIDPYINVDAGTMNPVEHGEVFVTDDGDETDQDIGNYERFLDRSISSDNYMTTGRVYQTVIERERNLEYGGRCVEVVPDIPNEVIRRIERATKTKPTQTAARLLNSAGIQPDFVLARAPQAIDEPRRRKLAIFCNVQAEDVISAPDAASTYEVPLNFEHDKLGEKILKKLGLKSRVRDMKEWQKLVDITRTARRGVRVGIVGKYFTTGGFILSDAYISVIEAIKHAAWHHKRKPILTWIDAEEYEKNPRKLSELKKFDGVIVPGGFGGRGVEGKIAAIGYARTNKIPFLGLCYGMQLATVEFARNVARLKGSVHTGEVEPKARHQVIHIMPEQEKLMLAHLPAFGGKYGGTMRLGAYPCLLNRQSRAYKAYGKELVSERHRHRFEVNNSYREILQKAGLMIAGTSPDGKLVEIIEVSKHPFFVGTQFHPEFKSRPLAPHPLFRDFIAAAMVGKK